jgi:hypothetical protein
VLTNSDIHPNHLHNISQSPPKILFFQGGVSPAAKLRRRGIARQVPPGLRGLDSRFLIHLAMIFILTHISGVPYFIVTIQIGSWFSVRASKRRSHSDDISLWRLHLKGASGLDLWDKSYDVLWCLEIFHRIMIGTHSVQFVLLHSFFLA